MTPLQALLRRLAPQRHDGEFVFCSVPEIPDAVRLGPVAMVIEPEGVTVVLRRGDADDEGLAYEFVAAWITLTVCSDLAAVGLTAAVSATLARDDIACNVIAGKYHDHLFVPADRAADAMSALDALAHTRS